MLPPFPMKLLTFCSWLTQVKRFRITSSRRPHTGGKCCLCSAQPVRCPKNFHYTSFLQETPAQQRPLRAVMQQHIPKKPWSHRGTGAAVGFLDGKRGCCLICLDINAGKSCASALLLLQLLEAAKQWRSDLNLLCHSGWNEFPDQVAAI